MRWLRVASPLWLSFLGCGLIKPGVGDKASRKQAKIASKVRALSKLLTQETTKKYEQYKVDFRAECDKINAIQHARMSAKYDSKIDDLEFQMLSLLKSVEDERNVLKQQISRLESKINGIETNCEQCSSEESSPNEMTSEVSDLTTVISIDDEEDFLDVTTTKDPLDFEINFTDMTTINTETGSGDDSVKPAIKSNLPVTQISVPARPVFSYFGKTRMDMATVPVDYIKEVIPCDIFLQQYLIMMDIFTVLGSKVCGFFDITCKLYTKGINTLVGKGPMYVKALKKSKACSIDSPQNILNVFKEADYYKANDPASYDSLKEIKGLMSMQYSFITTVARSNGTVNPQEALTKAYVRNLAPNHGSFTRNIVKPAMAASPDVKETLDLLCKYIETNSSRPASAWTDTCVSDSIDVQKSIVFRESEPYTEYLDPISTLMQNVYLRGKRGVYNKPRRTYFSKSRMNFNPNTDVFTQEKSLECDWFLHNFNESQTIFRMFSTIDCGTFAIGCKVFRHGQNSLVTRGEEYVEAIKKSSICKGKPLGNLLEFFGNNYTHYINNENDAYSALIEIKGLLGFQYEFITEVHATNGSLPAKEALVRAYDKTMAMHHGEFTKNLVRPAMGASPDFDMVTYLSCRYEHAEVASSVDVYGVDNCESESDVARTNITLAETPLYTSNLLPPLTLLNNAWKDGPGNPDATTVATITEETSNVVTENSWTTVTPNTPGTVGTPHGA